MKKNTISIALFALLLAASVSATAQVLPPPPPNQGNSGQPADAPIDGGAIALAVAGAAYGYKKMKAHKKNDAEPETDK
jgi:opacity protein-like surface antigen